MGGIRISRNMFFAIFISTMLALILSFLPDVDWQQKRIKGQPAVQTGQAVSTLTNGNLVDMIMRQNIHYPIRRISWNNQNLSIDLYISELTVIDNHHVIGDLFQIIKLSFLQVNNVQEVNVRVLVENNQKDNLLIALSADRSQMPAEIPVTPSISDQKSFIEKQFRIYYGTLWKQKFENAS